MKCRWCHRPAEVFTFNGRGYCKSCFGWMTRRASEFRGPVS